MILSLSLRAERSEARQSPRQRGIASVATLPRNDIHYRRLNAKTNSLEYVYP
jgi:hypothetical protein